MDVNPIYLYYFYSNIVLFYELEVKKNPLGFRVSDNSIKLFLIASGLRITLARKGEQLVNPIENNIPEKAFIKCKSSNRSILVSTLYHFRNSFAHARFDLVKLYNVEYIRLYDQQRNEITMSAQMPFSVFLGLVKIIASYRTK